MAALPGPHSPMVYLDLHALQGAIRRRGLVLLLLVCVATLGGYGASTLLTPIYESSALVVIAETPTEGSASDAAGRLAGLVGMQIDATAKRQEELLAMLNSREFIAEFVRGNDLLPELFHKRWDSAASRWRDPGDPPTMQEAYDLLKSDVVAIESSHRTALVRLSIRWRDPVMAAHWVQDLIDRANLRQRQMAMARSRAALTYLGNEMGKTSSIEIRQMISRLIEGQMREQMLASVTREYAFRMVDRPLPSDVDRPVRPRRGLVAALCGALAFMLACLVLLRSSLVAGSGAGG